MKYLDSIKVDDTEGWLDLALNCRKDNVKELKALKDEIKKYFHIYDRLINNPELEPSESDLIKHKDLLIHYYEKAPAALNRLLISRRNDHGLLDCPFCGNPVSPDTLDHFVPKDYWPEFSINPNNLVPQCRNCAPTKGSSYYCNESKRAIFLHPIYSDLLSKFKFKINVSFSEEPEEMSFSLRLLKPKTVSEQSAEKVINHLRNLKLNERIQIYCFREIKKWKSMLASRYFNIEDALRQRINERSPEEVCRDWKTALYTGILDNKNLIDYLNNIPNKNVNAVNKEQDTEIEL